MISRALVTAPLLWPLAAVGMSWTAPSLYELSGTDPSDITVADLNGDSAPDLAVAMYGLSSGDGKISVHLGSGDGRLTDHPLPVPFRPYGVAAGDWNGDGLPDLALTDGSADSRALHLYHGDGRGGFTAAATLAAAAFPAGIASADFNGDGQPDLAVTSALGEGITLFAGLGGGRFGPGSAVAGTRNLQATKLVAADLPPTASIDLLLPQGELRGAGDGTFHFRSALGGSRGVASADFDGDGNPDVATATSSRIDIWLAPADGGQLRYQQSLDVQGLSALAAADLDRDGWPELVYSAGDAIRVAAGGVAGFSPPQTVATCTGPGPLALPDLDGDGLRDLAAGCRGAGERAELVVLLQRADTTLPPSDNMVQFENAQRTVNEGDGAVRLSVQRIGGAGAASVDFATAPDTAQAVHDYQSASGTLQFRGGPEQQTITITLVADGEREPAETFTARLTSGNGVALAEPTVATITIAADPPAAATPAPRFTLTPERQSLEESTPLAVLTVERDSTVDPVAVTVRTADGSALSGSDYRGLDTRLRFDAGEQRLSLPISLMDDDEAEGDEQFSVKLLATDNTAAAAATVTIVDDDTGTTAVGTPPSSGGDNGGAGGGETASSGTDGGATAGTAGNGGGNSGTGSGVTSSGGGGPLFPLLLLMLLPLCRRATPRRG